MKRKSAKINYIYIHRYLYRDLFSFLNVTYVECHCFPDYRESDSESSGSGAVDVSVLGCDSVAGDSDWDSDVSDSDPSRSSRVSATASKSSGGAARPKRPPADPTWDAYDEEEVEPEELSEAFREQDGSNNSSVSRRVSGVTTSMLATQSAPVASKPATAVATTARQATLPDMGSTTKKVTWQFRPAQRSVCTGSRKEKERDMTSSLRFPEEGAGEFNRPPSSSSSSSSSSPSSSSSG